MCIKKEDYGLQIQRKQGCSLHPIPTSIIPISSGSDSRPFKDVEHMNETLIANWNRVVGPDNIVFHLGDFCLGGSAEWTKILKS